MYVKEFIILNTLPSFLNNLFSVRMAKINFHDFQKLILAALISYLTSDTVMYLANEC